MAFPSFFRIAALAVLSGLLLVACTRKVEQTEEIRPVRAIRVASGAADMVNEFPGEVRPRIESRLGFRVGGKIIARKVELGTPVRRGQVLMQLDPQDLRLAQAQADAALKAAQSNRDLAQAELKRYQDLRQRNFVSQAVLDAKQTAFHAAQSSYDQALAAYRNQSNQAGYAALLADADGVVTGIEAEAGQVVAAGTPVLRVARGSDKDVAIAIPEDKVDALRKVENIRVRTWARPDVALPGRLRELSPLADPITRTYAARIAVPDAGEQVKLGMTASVEFVSAAQHAALRLPLTALFKTDAGSAVWVVEGGQVRAVPVEVAGSAGSDMLVAGGIAPGQTVVTAGVNLLRPGQKVRILGEEAVAAPVAGATK